jgi:hypothetical protein
MHQERKPPKAGESIILAFIEGVGWLVKDVGPEVVSFDGGFVRFPFCLKSSGGAFPSG